MISSIEPVSAMAAEPVTVKRAELENQLSLAIKRAEQRYKQVDQLPHSKPMVANPPHLGIRVDIKV